MRNAVRILAGVFLCVAFSIAASGAGRVTWHHSSSPYRAEFRVVKAPTLPEAGTAVSVPLCGLGGEGGRDFTAYDVSGSRLRLLPLGDSINNEAIALVEVRPGTKRIFVYFGSNRAAAVASRSFMPGLMLDVRTLPDGPAKNWGQVESLLERSESMGRLFVPKIEQSYNPVNSTDSFIMVFEGYLNVRRPGRQTFMMVSDDAGYFFVDDKLLLQRNGRHHARDAVKGQCREEISLSAGPHKIKCVLVDFEGAQMMVIARWVDKKKKYALRSEDFVQPGETRFVGVEARYRHANLPAFWTKTLSYMNVRGAGQFTEVELGTYNQDTAVWNFRDGAEYRDAASCRRIIPGLHSMQVAVSQGGTRAMGVVSLPEKPPKRMRLSRNAQFRQYSELIMAQNLADIDTATLRSYRDFLKYHDLNKDLIPICEALLEKKGLGPQQSEAVLLDLARVSQTTDLEKSAEAYSDLLRQRKGKIQKKLLFRESTELELFGRRDLEKARDLVSRASLLAPRRDKSLGELKMHLALQSGNVEEAQKFLDLLLSGREIAEKQRLAAVKANALRERYRDLLKAGFLLRAREALVQWAEISPHDYTTGALPLARSRMWQELDWLDGALGELDGAILLHPLLPNLPDVELERGRICQKAGDREKAEEIFSRIVDEFPNHPAADTAKELTR